MGLFLAARFCAGTGMTLLRATVAWHVYELSGSALQLGLIGAVQFIPTVLLSLVAGAAADSYDRRRIVIASQALALLSSAALAFLTAGSSISLGAIYAALFLSAAAASFESPAGASILPQLVSREQFPSATTIQSSIRNLAWVTGPAAAGFAIDAIGIAGTYLLHTVLLLVSSGFIAALRPRLPEGEPSGVSMDAIREGVRFVRSRPAILGAMTLDMLAVIFGAAEVLLPVFARDILGVGARGYGVLSASFQAGTVSMALLLVALPPMRRAGRALLISVAGYGLFTFGFGLSRVFPLSIALYASAGMADQVSMIARSVLIQLSTPDALRGRVNSVNFVFIGASNHLGAVEAGLVAWLVSAPFAAISGGLAALAIAGFMAWRIPELRRYDAGVSELPSGGTTESALHGREGSSRGE